MKRYLATAAVLLAAAPVLAQMVPVPVKTALADPGRPPEDTKRDVARKPGEMMVFARVKPGQTVVDLLPGGGYFTRIFAKTVGAKGMVYAFLPQFIADKSPKAKANVDALVAAYPNVKETIGSIADLQASNVDLVWTAQNYHDVKNAPNGTETLNKAVFAALKHGGYYVIVDHAAPDGTGAADTSTLHRIDEALVKQEVTAAGFVLDGESKLLRNPADDRMKKVFDPTIRGETDQFALRFRKP